MMSSSGGDGKKSETEVLKVRAEISQEGMKQLGARTGTRDEEGDLPEREIGEGS